MPRNGKMTEGRPGVARGWGQEEWRKIANGHRVSFWGDERVLE